MEGRRTCNNYTFKTYTQVLVDKTAQNQTKTTTHSLAKHTHRYMWTRLQWNRYDHNVSPQLLGQFLFRYWAMIETHMHTQK